MAWVGLVYRAERTSVGRRAALAIVRGAVIVLIAAIICQPTLVLQRNRVEASHVSLVLDRSLSMAAKETYQDEALASAIARGSGLAEPAAVAVHGVRLGGVGEGNRVLVLGAGTIGLLSIMAAREAGAGEISITARHGHQAEAARRMGATRVFPANPEGDRDRADFFRDSLPDVVLETAGGAGETLNDAIQSVRPGGTVVLLGIFPSQPSCDALSLVVKEVRLVGSLTYGRRDGRADFELALEMMASTAPVVRDLVTHRFELEGIQEAFETASDKKRGAIKVAVTP